MSKTIKVGDNVVTKSGHFGVVVARYKEPLGYYYLYDVRIESGKTITTRYVKHD